MSESEIVHTTFQAVDDEGNVHKILCRKDYDGDTLLWRPQCFTSDAQLVEVIDHQTFEVCSTGKILRTIGEGDSHRGGS